MSFVKGASVFSVLMAILAFGKCGDVLRQRSDDTNLEYLSTLLTQQASTIQHMQAEIDSLKALRVEIATLNGQMTDLLTPVVFSANVRDGTYNHGQIIPFSDIIVDTAHIYDTVSGIATIPHSGTYFIYLRADSDVNENLIIDIYVNDKAVAAGFAQSGAMSSGAVALCLNRGDRVWASVTHNVLYSTVVKWGTLF